MGEAKKACLLTMATMASLIVMVGVLLSRLINIDLDQVGWLGMVLYTVYADCDPITAGQVKKKDQVRGMEMEMEMTVIGFAPSCPSRCW